MRASTSPVIAIFVASMSPDTLRQRHRALAIVLGTLPSVDPAVLSIHYRECGDVTRAAQYAIAAADQASNALAFERAATWLFYLGLPARAALVTT